ncbi:MAG: hypothetical protein HQL44_09375 [Alphaproteobacteria bacterium]|nr:hypothetical protein [Alphaproteobacteria bacterium]
MGQAPQTPASERLDPEKVAYWYFRLNGFLQIENFVVHPERRGSQRTDADLLAVRFPYRAERLFDDPNDIMADDVAGLSLSRDQIEVVIVEVKTNQPCTLNGPWTQSDRKNIHRVLAAVGCLPHADIDQAATNLYEKGLHDAHNSLRIRLVAVGKDRSIGLGTKYPQVKQLIWKDFTYKRLHSYRQQKKDVHQWDNHGLKIKGQAEMAANEERFVEQMLLLMGVRNDNPGS